MDFEKDGAFSTLIKNNGVSILLDCGINKNFDISNYEKYEEYLKKVDLILISGSELKLCGALIYLLDKYNFYGNVFSTLPAKYLMNVNLTLKNIFLPFEFKNRRDEIELLKSFYLLIDRVQEIKFDEKVKLKIRNKTKVAFSAHSKGTSLGSCYYNLRIGKLKILYLIDYNFKNADSLNAIDQKVMFNEEFDFVISYL